jgi:hypothetical protein
MVFVLVAGVRDWMDGLVLLCKQDADAEMECHLIHPVAVIATL